MPINRYIVELEKIDIKLQSVVRHSANAINNWCIPLRIVDSLHRYPLQPRKLPTHTVQNLVAETFKPIRSTHRITFLPPCAKHLQARVPCESRAAEKLLADLI